MYGEKRAEPEFNAIAFYLHVAGKCLFSSVLDASRYVGGRGVVGQKGRG